MKRAIKRHLGAMLLLLTWLHAAEPISSVSSEDIRVARLKGDCAGALSFTFDDNLRDQDDVAVPLLEKYGIHATFFVIPGRTPETNEEAAKMKVSDWGSISWQRLRELAAQGHEIASHSWTHEPLKICNDEQLEAQVAKAHKCIAEKIGIPPLSFAAPGNGWDARVRAVANKYHPVLRDRQERFGDWPPTNKGFTAAKANALVNHALANGEAMVWMIHAITNGYNAVASPEVLENHLKFVASRRDAIWVDTFANVKRYMMERDAATLTQLISGDQASFNLACALDPTQFNYPLTVIIPAEHAVQVEAKRTDDGVSLPVEIRSDRILVQAAPSAARVVVTWRRDVK